MENILFIGGGGFLGASVVRLFARQCEGKFGIFVQERAGASLARLDGVDANFFFCDFADIERVVSFIQENNISVVVHMVSSLLPASGHEAFAKEMETVVTPTARLANACAQMQVKLVYFSSGGTIYGNVASGNSIVEETPTSPVSYYGLSKKIIEESIEFEHRKNGLQYIIIRPANPYGPGQNIYANQGLVAVCLGKVFSGDVLQIRGDGNALRDYIYIDDFASAVFDIITSGVSNTVVNVGSGEGLSIMDVIGTVRRVSGRELKVESIQSMFSDVVNVVLDVTKMHSLSSAAHTPFAVGVEKFYNHLLQCQNL